jgi:uncharacterized membrane protein YdbT with pleckstrin-like domain
MIDLYSGETVVYTVRKHWFVLLGPILLALLILFLPLFFLSFNIPEGFISIKVSDADRTGSILWIFYLTILLFTWISLFVRWTQYYLNMWIITDKRVIEAQQNGFFNREVSSIPFDKIQDIIIETKGLFPTIFNFGSLEIETAGDKEGKFIMHTAALPNKAKEMILGKQRSHITQVTQITH